MIDLVKKSMLAGLGFASITKDKVEEIAKDLMKQGSLSEQEGRKFVEEMMGYAEKTKGDVEKYIDKRIENTLVKLDLARKSDVEELRAEIKNLQKDETSNTASDD